MKKQGWRSWAALKVGFSGKNWGTPFLALLHKHGMPGEDFVLKRPTPNLSGFQERPASFSDALHGTRSVIGVGLQLLRSLWSCLTRRVYPYFLATCTG